MKKGLVVFVLIFFVALSAFARGDREWPSRPITIVVSAGAGGGTDLGNRALAAAMEDYLGARITVVNNTGGGGGAAAHQVFSAPHDGYMWLGFFEGIFSNAVMGTHHGTSNDWDYFILGGTPGIMSVAPGSPFQTAGDVIAAMRNNPGSIRLAASSAGTIWDIKSSLMAQAAGVEYTFIPYPGSNPSILALIAGEVDVIITGLGEQVDFLEAHRLTPLAMIELEGMRVPGFDHVVPSILNYVPAMAEVLPIHQTIGFAVPRGVPQEVRSSIAEAFSRAMRSEGIRNYTQNFFIAPSGAYGAASLDVAHRMESTLGWIMYDRGVGTVSPAALGIPRP
ncbi:MAG: tripartite tricarboxylate transporter substrate binding protein [Treponema sp.]|nr:tripartite tricarboxylate transporter substrate binding protein [Treponema sp.]